MPSEVDYERLNGAIELLGQQNKDLKAEIARLRGLMVECEDCGFEYHRQHFKQDRPCPVCDLVECQARIERLERVLAPLISEAALDGRWNGEEPEGQGLPDGETWAHYCHAISARGRYEQLTGKPWTPEAAEKAKEG